jgi:hypothetical protein
MENTLFHVLREKLSAVHYRTSDGCDSLCFSLILGEPSLCLVGLRSTVESVPLTRRKRDKKKIERGKER